MKQITRQHHVPQWLKQRVRRKYPEVSHLVGCNTVWLDGPAGVSWVDHYGSDGDTFISEPYACIEHVEADLQRFAESIDAEVHIDANSEHCPPHTIRVELSPLGDLRDWVPFPKSVGPGLLDRIYIMRGESRQRYYLFQDGWTRVHKTYINQLLRSEGFDNEQQWQFFNKT